MTYNFNFMN